MADLLNPITIQELDHRPVTVLRFYKPTAAAVKAVANGLGLDLPKPLQSAQTGDVLVLWTGPAEWLLVGLDAKVTIDRLQGQDGVWHCADLTHGLTPISIQGAAARELIAKGCSLDLHARAFLPGQVAGTVLAQVDLYLHKVAEDRFDLYCDRSCAEHITTWLHEAAGVMQAGCP